MKRPKILTILCVLGYLSVVFTFPQVFSPPIKKLGLFVPALYGVLVSAGFIACVGIWYLKRWGAELFVMSFFAKTLFFMMTDQMGFSFYLGLVFSVFFIVSLLRFYKQMS